LLSQGAETSTRPRQSLDNADSHTAHKVMTLLFGESREGKKKDWRVVSVRSGSSLWSSG
jgi:hypothetical protein